MSDRDDHLKKLQDEVDAFTLACMGSFQYFAEHCLKIKTKSKGIQPLNFNRAQMYLDYVVNMMMAKYGKVRVIIVKARQQGLSTYIEARGYWKVSFTPDTNVFIMTHEAEASKNLLDMAKRYHEYCPAEIRPILSRSNREEMVFGENGCKYVVGTAKTADSGRSQTIQFFHGSEVAYWREAEEISSGAMEGIPEEDDTESYLESTAKGFGGYFHKTWASAIYPDQTETPNWNGYIRVFIPWFWEPSYTIDVDDDFELEEDEEELKAAYGLTNGQVAWRRRKISKVGGDVARFGRDYPATPEEAFNSSIENILIPPLLVQQARRNHIIDKYEPFGPLVLGVDVAREGDDATAFALRQGRVLLWTVKFNGYTTIQVASQVMHAIKKYQIRYINIDMTGGYGAGVYDQLVAWGLGDRVSGINFAERAIDEERYKNKRAEMWYSVKEWLEDGAQIPDDDALQTDLCSVAYKFDTTYERLQLRSKAEQKKLLKKSPDEGDAIALTFARPGLNIDSMNGAGDSFDPTDILDRGGYDY